MVKQVERGTCPLCRRELEWNTLVEYMRHIKANKLEIDGKYGDDPNAVPYNLRSNTAVAARAGALGEVGHVEGRHAGYLICLCPLLLQCLCFANVLTCCGHVFLLPPLLFPAGWHSDSELRVVVKRQHS